MLRSRSQYLQSIAQVKFAPFKQSRMFDAVGVLAALARERGRSHFGTMSVPKDILDIVGAVTSDAEAVAVAIVVRASPQGAVQAGARAVIAADGAITGGWLAGAAADEAFRVAQATLEDGRPRLFRAAKGFDVLVEPLLPRPTLVIVGATPVAVALADLARRLGFFVTVCAPAAAHGAFAEADRLVDGFALPEDLGGALYLVVATQGAGERAALAAIARRPLKYLAVVAPRRRGEALKRALERRRGAVARVEGIRAPAGLDIGAVTPEEIALAIVAEMVAIRRRGALPERLS